MYTECLQVIENSIGKNNSDYSGTLNNRGELYTQMKEYKKAEKDLLESAALTKKLFGEFHYQYSVLLNNLAALYFETGQIKKCEKNLIRANEIIINKINESVNYMTGQESEAFLNSTDYLFSTYYSFYFNERRRNTALAGFAYDNILARKGLMLQAEKNLRKSVYQTSDSLLIKDYLEFIALKEKQGRLFTSNQQVIEDSSKLINERAEILEKRVTTHPKIVNTRAQINIAGWKDIKKSLQKDEVAIEFIAFGYRNLFFTDSTFYCALILRPDDKNPKMIFLFEEKQLDTLLKKDNYHTEEEFIGHLYHITKRNQEGFKPDDDKISKKLYDLIWSPIEKHLDGAKTIYYSPGGLLHNISFAALSINDSTYVSDKYKLNSLISTRNIISHKRFVIDTEYKVSLYGGIDYDVKPEQIEKLTRSYKKSDKLEADKNKVKLLSQTVSRGTTWSYLHGTLEETEAIEALFKAQKVGVESYKGENAVEETFKQYTGNKVSPNIIHIATHGFFIEDPETNNNSGPSEDKYNAFEISKNPLFRSGLLFAGANRSWNNLNMPDDAEDGILTAYEVSNTNLMNTELVVLSACETGLGEIKGSEGVYGLQRSFKIAGAEYVIMSLWQIPDYQTVELMKLFYTYKNLNFTIPEAFNLAQNEMKRKYLPYYWAAFVLLK
jgi:CHAT domain-containing protein